jgi:hypothetical protein
MAMVNMAIQVIPAATVIGMRCEAKIEEPTAEEETATIAVRKDPRE